MSHLALQFCDGGQTVTCPRPANALKLMHETAGPPEDLAESLSDILGLNTLSHALFSCYTPRAFRFGLTKENKKIEVINAQRHALSRRELGPRRRLF